MYAEHTLNMDYTEPNPTVMVTPTKYRFVVEHSSSSPEGILAEHFKTNREDVLAWLQSLFPNINFETYEGGIDQWFGLGSVTLWELGLEFNFKYTTTIEVTIE